MKLFGQIAVHVRGDEILRRPGILDKLKRFFGGQIDLRTGHMKSSIEAAALVDGVRDALKSIGISNAIALIVDEILVFQDKEGRPDDLGDLVLAFHEHSSVIGGGFDLLRLTVEHVEAGLHMVIEVQAKSEHAVTDPAVRVIVSGRLRDLEPQKGEDAESYRRRVEPLAKDASALEVARLQFESFVTRVRDAIGAAMPEAKVQVVTAEARVQRPPTDGDRERGRREDADPRSRHYDPYDHYYYSPMGAMWDVLLWSSLFSMMHTPHYTIVNQQNAPVGHTDDPGAEHATGDHGGDHSAEAGGDHGGDAGADGGGDGGWGDWGGDGGGDFGGDFGGFD